MQHSNLSFLVWYRVMFLMSTAKKVFSAKEIQRQLGLKRYEPVWAIGTGKAASPEDAINVHKYIRSWFIKNEISDVPIIYGGSVSPENAHDFLVDEEINGVLIGGASLDAEKFVEIVKCIK